MCIMEHKARSYDAYLENENSNRQIVFFTQAFCFSGRLRFCLRETLWCELVDRGLLKFRVNGSRWEVLFYICPPLHDDHDLDDDYDDHHDADY